MPTFRLSALLMPVAALLAVLPVPAASAQCAICDKEVVLDRPLAQCFLDRYGELAASDRPVIAVDLEACTETGRGVVEALSPPGAARLGPSRRFMVSRAQLQCLHERLTDGELDLDPAARIDLEDCP